MKKNLNNKIIFVFALIIFGLFINCNISYATDNVIVQSTTYNNAFVESYIDAGQSPFGASEKIIDVYHESHPEVFTFTSGELPKYKLLLKNYMYSTPDVYRYYFIYTSCPLQYYSSDNTFNFMYNEVPAQYYVFYTDSAGFYTYTSNINETNSETTLLQIPRDYMVIDYVASNYDVYNALNSGELVFQQPTLGKVTILAPVIQREKTKGTLQVVLREIVLILPLIILVLVSFLGLRKALKMLFQLLRHS